MEKKTIGSFIAALRKASGLTQRQLADKLNVSDKAVSRWERDECAPDLSLIPVLAEIFDVTTDEILRGQRTNPDIGPRPVDTDKAKRQMEYLLRSAQNKFRMRTIICATISVLGIILACILNFEFNAPNAGFLASLTFTIFAAVLQITGLISAHGSLDGMEDEDNTIIRCKLSMINWTQIVLSLSMIALTLTIPMAGSQETVSFLTCLTAGLKWALGAAILCFVTCLIINIIHLRRYKAPGAGKLLICRSISALLLIGVLVGHISLNHFLLNNRHRYAPCDTYTTLHEFYEIMTEKRTEQGYPIWIENDYYDTENNHKQFLYIYHDPYTEEKTLYTHDDLVETLTEPTNPYKTSEKTFIPEYGYEFLHFNRSIVYYEVTGGEDIIPIYTFTQDQFQQSEKTITSYSLLYSASYLLPIAIGYCLYFLLRKKHA